MATPAVIRFRILHNQYHRPRLHTLIPQVIGALAAELSGDVLLLVSGLGLQLPTVPPLRNGFRKPDAGEVNLNLPKPEMVQGVGAHVAAEEAYEKYMQEGRVS